MTILLDQIFFKLPKNRPPTKKQVVCMHAFYKSALKSKELYNFIDSEIKNWWFKSKSDSWGDIESWEDAEMFMWKIGSGNIILCTKMNISLFEYFFSSVKKEEGYAWFTNEKFIKDTMEFIKKFVYDENCKCDNFFVEHLLCEYKTISNLCCSNVNDFEKDVLSALRELISSALFCIKNKEQRSIVVNSGVGDICKCSTFNIFFLCSAIQRCTIKSNVHKPLIEHLRKTFPCPTPEELFLENNREYEKDV